MRKIKLFFITGLLCLYTFTSAKEIDQEIVKVCKGKVIRFENFESKFVTSRNVDIWLPESYSANNKYAVIYMHDGQMLFDSTTTWNHQEWMVDETLSKLMDEGKIKSCIVVGIWNSGDGRHAEYYPQKAYDLLDANLKKEIDNKSIRNGYGKPFPNGIQSDKYLKFLTMELKPFIDKKFSTYTDRKNTFIVGSSMGGLISMYAICEYPEIFGGAACLSTHWPGFSPFEGNPIPQSFADYLDQNLPNPEKVKIYFDYGTETLDSFYESGQMLIDKVMEKHHFTENNWLTKKFPGENHSEKSWQKRIHIPMIFLIRNNK